MGAKQGRTFLLGVRPFASHEIPMPTRPPTYRPRFQPPTHDQARGSAASRGYDRQWAKLRLAHLRANPLCVFCQRAAVLVDHRVPIAVDPTRRLDPTNLRSCCDDCHQKLTANFKTTGVNEMPQLVTGFWL